MTVLYPPQEVITPSYILSFIIIGKKRLSLREYIKRGIHELFRMIS